MSTAVKPVQADLLLTVLTGPDKGAVYKIVKQQVRLGRSADNDIVIQDLRSSRHHAMIEITPQGVVVQDISSQNSIEVDGKNVKTSLLKPGAQITLGSTVLLFEIKTALPENVPGAALAPVSAPVLTPQQVSVTQPQGLSTSGNYGGPITPQSYQIPKAAPDTGKRNFYIVSALVIGGLVYFLMSEDSVQKKDIPIRSDSLIEEDIKAAQERKDAIIKLQADKGVGTPEYSEVQALYLQGFRDYREGNFSRALQAFESVLALNPRHELAFKYRDLSKRRLDELIQLTMREGKRFMEQGKFAQARNSYQQVMILVGDPKNKTFIEAREYFNESTILLKGAY